MLFGWDISTSIIGVAIFNNDGRFVTSTHHDLRKVEGELLDKATATEAFVRDTVRVYIRDEKNYHFIEDRLANFSAGRTMLQTLMKLGAFNMVVSWMILKETLTNELPDSVHEVRHMHPCTIKSIMKQEGLVIPKGGDKKLLTLDFVSRREPTFPLERNRNDKPQPWCFDMADAYIVARAGWLRFTKAQNDRQGKEAPLSP